MFECVLCIAGSIFCVCMCLCASYCTSVGRHCIGQAQCVGWTQEVGRQACGPLPLGPQGSYHRWPTDISPGLGLAKTSYGEKERARLMTFSAWKDERQTARWKMHKDTLPLLRWDFSRCSDSRNWEWRKPGKWWVYSMESQVRPPVFTGLNQPHSWQLSRWKISVLRSRFT